MTLVINPGFKLHLVELCSCIVGSQGQEGGSGKPSITRLSTPRAALDHSIQLCFQHVLRADKCDVLQREEAPWLRHIAPAQVVSWWEAKEEGEGLAGARRDVNVNKSPHIISFPALHSLPPCLSLLWASLKSGNYMLRKTLQLNI